MKYLIIIAALLLMSAHVSGQYQSSKQGIQFEENLMWPQILEKAKKENKYIFVHCTATWCIPCKEMERDVYTLDSIGEFINANFIAIMVQMDSTVKDQPSVKSWYGEAARIKDRHSVSGFPTYLFYTPSGDIVYKDEGARKPGEFMALAKKAADPNLPYLKFLKKYREGNIADSSLLKLITHTNWLQPALATRMSHDYTRKLLQSGDVTRLYDPENVRLMAAFTKTRQDPAYPVFYNDGEKVDAAMQEKGFAESVIDVVITNEFIKPYITSGATMPDWKRIEKEIGEHYDKDFAERNVLWARALWYNNKGDKRRFVSYAVDKINKYGVTNNWYGDLVLNNVAWNVFLHSSDTNEILSALNWMEGVTKRITDGNKATALDTYANLLYKANRKEEAIAVEKQVVALEPARKEFRETLKKMQNGVPTWPLN